MPAVVSEASLVRTPSHSQAAGSRSQDGTDPASSPFSELLDGETSDTGTTDSAAKPAGDKSADAASSKEKADKPQDAKAEEVNPAADVAAELILVIAAAGQQPAPKDNEAEPGIPVAPVESTPDEAQPGADVVPADDAPAVSQPAAAAVAAPVPAAVPAVQEAAATPVDAEAVPTATLAALPGHAVKQPIGEQVAETQTEVPPTTAEVSPETVESTADAAVSKAANPAPARTGNTAPAEEMPSVPAETKTASESKAPPPSPTPKPSADAEPARKTASHPADAAAPIAQRSSDTVDPQPKAMAPQASAETAVNAAALPAPAATQVAHNAAQPVMPQPAPHADKVPVAGLAVEIAARVQNGENRFEIRLDPPELGRIDVHLHIDGEGQVTSHLRVERAETLDMLRRDAPALERALQQAGLKTSDSGLQFSLRDQSFSQQNQNRDMPAMTRIVVPDESLAPVETQRHYGRLAGLGSGVDIRV